MLLLGQSPLTPSVLEPRLDGFLLWGAGPSPQCQSHRTHGQELERGAEEGEKRGLNRTLAQELGMPACQRVIEQLRCHVKLVNAPGEHLHVDLCANTVISSDKYTFPARFPSLMIISSKMNSSCSFPIIEDNILKN